MDYHTHLLIVSLGQGAQHPYKFIENSQTLSNLMKSFSKFDITVISLDIIIASRIKSYSTI